MAGAPRMLVVAAVLAVLLWMGYESARYGVSGTASANGVRELERMSKIRGGQVASWWRDDLQRAVTHVPEDPFAREALALVIARNSNEPSDFEEAQRNLAAAIEQRPGSPYTWANLAVVKYRLGDTGQMFEKTLVNASNLGPYEPEVQQIVADLGLAVYDEVAPATRAAIERMVAAGMKRNAAEILQIASRRGRLGIACSHLDGVPRLTASKWTQICQSMEATS
jgi:predicted Zn-dependent protease